MMLNDLLKQRKMSRYRLSQLSSVPYTTLNDICNEKTGLNKCSAETVYRIARALEVSMEELLEPYCEYRCSFESYKSNVCHKLKELGDIDFLIHTLESDEIRICYQRKWYPESLYLLAMVDYISRINHVALCKDYDDLRKQKLTEVIYPSGILAIAAAEKNDTVKHQAEREAIPEFMRFNIVENEVRNVI